MFGAGIEKNVKLGFRRPLPISKSILSPNDPESGFSPKKRRLTIPVNGVRPLPFLSLDRFGTDPTNSEFNPEDVKIGDGLKRAVSAEPPETPIPSGNILKKQLSETRKLSSGGRDLPNYA